MSTVVAGHKDINNSLWSRVECCCFNRSATSVSAKSAVKLISTTIIDGDYQPKISDRDSCHVPGLIRFTQNNCSRNCMDEEVGQDKVDKTEVSAIEGLPISNNEMPETSLSKKKEAIENQKVLDEDKASGDTWKAKCYRQNNTNRVF